MRVDVIPPRAGVELGRHPLSPSRGAAVSGLRGNRAPGEAPTAEGSEALWQEVDKQYVGFAALQEDDEPTEGFWLTEAEHAELRRWRNEARREAWMLGRWVSKALILRRLAPRQADLLSIEVLSRDQAGRAVRPTVRLRGEPLPIHLSISHSSAGVLVAVSTDPEVRVGVDLTEHEGVRPESLEAWLTPGERDRLRGVDRRAVADCWAVKEAVYKACNEGEPFSPQTIDVAGSREGGYSCHYRGTALRGTCDIRVWDIAGQSAAAVVRSLRRRRMPIRSPAATGDVLGS